MSKLRFKYKALLLYVLAVLAVLVIPAASSIVDPSPAQAQHAPYDLAVEIESSEVSGRYSFIASNLGAQDAFGVTVRIDLPDQVIDRYPSEYDPSAGVWNVGRLDRGTSAEIVLATRMAPELVSIYPDKLSVPARAVISSAFLEPPALLHNNSAEEWAAVSPQGMLDAAGGNYRLGALLDNPLPQDGDTVNLSVRMFFFSASGRDGHAYGVKVRIRLPVGLGSPTVQLPTYIDTTFTPVPGEARTWEWDVGDTSRFVELGLAIPVTSRAEVDGKCITADLTVERPYDDPRNNHAKACIGDYLPVLLQTGETDLFTLYPCVGVSSYPCTGAGILEVAAIGGTAAEHAAFLHPEVVMPPDQVVVHVLDPGGARSG